MSKSTLFTLFLAGILVVVVAELLADEYVKIPQTIEADTLQQEDTSGVLPPPTPKIDTSSPASEAENPIEEKQPTSSENSATVLNPPPPSSHTHDVPTINLELLTKAGFENVSLQRVLFQGNFLGLFDINDIASVPVIEQNALKNNAAPIAIFFEFSLQDEGTADELYQLLEQKAKGQLGVTVNETNSFRGHSFYINVLEHPEHVFLVVRTKKNVYALTYQKEYHASVTQLLQLLP